MSPAPVKNQEPIEINKSVLYIRGRETRDKEKMLDKVFAAVSMLGVLAFMGVVIIGVWEPDLWIVTIVILGIAILFFWEEIKAGGSHLENEPEHEQKDD